MGYGNYVRGKTLFTQEDPRDTLYIVLAGKVKIGRRAIDGRENMLSVMGPSDMFGEVALFDPGPRTATAVMVTDARLASLAHTALRPWLTDRPEIAEQLLRVLARRLRRTNDALADLIFTDVPARVAKQLLALSERFGTAEPDGLRVDDDLTQEEFAPAGRDLPGDGQQDPARVRRPRLGPSGGPVADHPGQRTLGSAGTLATQDRHVHGGRR